jgi:hypothetical protein
LLLVILQISSQASFSQARFRLQSYYLCLQSSWDYKCVPSCTAPPKSFLYGLSGQCIHHKQLQQVSRLSSLLLHAFISGVNQMIFTI